MKSSQDQRNAIEKLYKSGSISKEEYDAMIRILEPEPTPKPIQNPTDKKSKKPFIILAIMMILFIGYGIKSLMGSKAGDELTKENEMAMSLAKMECDCEVSLQDEFLSDLVHLNNQIENNQFTYKSEAREKFEELSNDLNSKKESSISCQEVEKSKLEFFNKYPAGTKKYLRLDSIYIVYLNDAKANLIGRHSLLQEELKQETARYEKLLDEKLGYESEDHKNAEVSRVESLLNYFFYYYNQGISNGTLNNAIFNYINLPFHYNGQPNLYAEQLANVVLNDRNSCESCYYGIENSTTEFKSKEGDLLVWKCKIRLNYSSNSEYQIYDAVFKLKENKISFFEIVNI